MDNKAAADSIISRKSWPIVVWLAGFLDWAEREAVLGDFTESGESGGRAIASVLGLVVRRRTAVLLDRRLWFAVAIVILPISYLLSAIAQTTAGAGAVYSWMYLNNWDWALTRNPGFWYALRETATNFAIACIVLACWSWSAGFLIGRLPSAVVRACRNIFIVLLATSFLSDADGQIIHFWMSLHVLQGRSLPDPNAPITANVFYHVFFPWIVLSVLVILPAFAGIRHGSRPFFLSQESRVVVLTAAALSLLVLMFQVSGLVLLLGTDVRQWLWRNRNAMQMLPLLCCWPMFYLLAVGRARHRRRKAA